MLPCRLSLAHWADIFPFPCQQLELPPALDRKTLEACLQGVGGAHRWDAIHGQIVAYLVARQLQEHTMQRDPSSVRTLQVIMESVDHRDERTAVLATLKDRVTDFMRREKERLAADARVRSESRRKAAQVATTVEAAGKRKRSDVASTVPVAPVLGTPRSVRRRGGAAAYATTPGSGRRATPAVTPRHGKPVEPSVCPIALEAVMEVVADEQAPVAVDVV